MRRVVVRCTSQFSQPEVTRSRKMSDNTIPEYLQPALAQLEKARAAHLENARLMDETVTAIERA
ncbi:TPA: glycoprotein 3, partial [Escherichia coli]|nr:glycoprotein 3 [Escherichia coli]